MASNYSQKSNSSVSRRKTSSGSRAGAAPRSGVNSSSRKSYTPSRRVSSSSAASRSTTRRVDTSSKSSSRSNRAKASSNVRQTTPRSSSQGTVRQTASRQGSSLVEPSFRRNTGGSISSVRVGDLNQAIRDSRVKKSYRRYVLRTLLVFAVLISILVAGILVYNSSLFTISKVSVNGVEHLTADEMTDIASVPEGMTLLRVDESGIVHRLQQEAWVDEAKLSRVFPDTLKIDIKERSIAAVVEVSAEDSSEHETWAIASDGTWLMNIPPENTAEAASVSAKVYEDAQIVLRISDVPYGVKPEVGEVCSDASITNALAIVAGFTTELADQVKSVSATGTETTTLILDNGIEIAFGTADDIRDKERVCLQLMEEYAGEISYINVRVVDKPSFRTL